MTSELTFLIIGVLLIYLVIRLGQEAKIRYKESFSPSTSDSVIKRNLDDLVDGLFLVFRNLSDVMYRGTHEQLLEYNRSARSVRPKQQTPKQEAPLTDT